MMLVRVTTNSIIFREDDRVTFQNFRVTVCMRVWVIADEGEGNQLSYLW